jgi:hypothetical protein
MLFLPLGSCVHGAYLTEYEINRLVESCKEQATPDHDQKLLLPPPPDEDDETTEEEFEGGRDPDVRRLRSRGRRNGQSLDVNALKARSAWVGARRSYPRHDTAERHHWPAGRSRPRNMLKYPDRLSRKAT